jgi:ribosomal protein L11 methyltransferase
MTTPSCHYVEVSASRDYEDQLVPIWWQCGYAGLVEEERDEAVTWRVFFDASVVPEVLHDCAARCAALHQTVTARVQTQPLQDWLSQWKTFFTPFEVSPKLVITTDGISHTPKPGQSPIVIVAGMAFGTGQHPTTQLIARAVAEDYPERRWPRLLDVGTGTGILGLVALFCGVSHVDGIDIDEDALVCAKENCLKNKMLERVFLSTTLNDVAGPYPVIVANILLDPLVEMAPRLASLLAKDGDLYLSGILSEQESPLRAAYDKVGLRHVRTTTQGEWAMVHMRKL